MPLDGHSFLVSQGWSGKGTGLRQGAITRPVIVNQKKTLSGIGKDRDEAFPFWDHLFSAAAKSLQVKISSDDDEEGKTSISTEATLTLKRTTTGILCNRRPPGGTLVSSSGTDTLDSVLMPRLSLLAMAKREAAKRGLYARFFRGPILGPDIILSKPEEDVEAEPTLLSQKSKETDADIQTEKKRKRGDEEKEKMGCKEDAEGRRQRRLRKAEKKTAKLARDEKRERKCRKLEKRADGDVTKEEWKRLRKELRALEREESQAVLNRDGDMEEDDEDKRKKPKKSNQLEEAEALEKKGKRRLKMRESDDTLDVADNAGRSDKVRAGKKRKRKESSL
ncbi:uncharacterized protein BT62DRAFT_997481 [Guyanagaster necrorhizus]|uniref:G-patch domain-containing protein n=1 Tax=Guyanagaster necrorhizus TaxID=856835 RepID=A0A9P8AMM2_9AGAR|nr:uncharacterized protein BT62DRAFT_997481 [Guyanagaster necrorhizus MCA 3950]KAG7440841.1 hypothetical protein BT62DRAFT_997481 [Guyanagaster necrorhizus MCA 3950]